MTALAPVSRVRPVNEAVNPPIERVYEPQRIIMIYPQVLISVPKLSPEPDLITLRQ
jgi:hypothetical protein